MKKRIGFILVLTIALFHMALSAVGPAETSVALASPLECTHPMTMQHSMPSFCDRPGYIRFECMTCHTIVSETIIPAIQHVWREYTRQPTCIRPGEYYKKCDWCGRTSDSVFYDVLPHKPNPPATEAPTCTKNGSIYVTCQTCYNRISAEPIPATGHSPYISKDDPATCTEDGIFEESCSVCHEVLTSNIFPATGHTPGEWIAGDAATCAFEGTEHQDCMTCGERVNTRPVPKAPHTLGPITLATPATCYSLGRKEQRCTACGDVLNEWDVPMTSHTPGTWSTTVPATCAKEGEQEQRCAACSELLDTRPLSARGHRPGEWITSSAATCTQAGKQVRRCTACGKLLNTSTTAALGHTPGEWVVTLPQTADSPGQESRLCAACGETISTRAIPATGQTQPGRPAAPAGKPMEETAPNLAEKYPAYTPIDLTKPKVHTFPLVAEGGYVVGAVTVTVDDKGQITIAFTLTAKGAYVMAGGLAFLPQSKDLSELTPEDLQETAIGPAAEFAWTAPIGSIPQSNGTAMLCLNLAVDFDIHADGVTEYKPEEV